MASPYSYVRAIFRADAAKQGGLVRRKIDDVHRLASLDALRAEVELRGFHLLETGDQYVVICNSVTGREDRA